ncbi:MAG: MFS transporter [Bifidobacterium sp.]|jgi:predicted MFS family arabinose efflux permease|nr:MFS transporter [Bifidobacterium sp.]
MTSFALVIWVYRQQGSALMSSLMAACSYAPYVCTGVFSSALVERWNAKRTMLACDAASACCTLLMVLMYRLGRLDLPTLYALSMLSGFTGSLQQPASEIATSSLVSPAQRQWAGGLRSFSYAVTTMVVPLASTALLSNVGLVNVAMVDLATFAVAFTSLTAFVHIPSRRVERADAKAVSYAGSIRDAWHWLHENSQLLSVLLFMSWINLFASMDDAALAPMILSRTGSERILGLVNATAGLAMTVGSIAMTMLPRPKNRIRAMAISMLFSFAIGNVLLALPAGLMVWCVGIACCWVAVPIEMTNQDALMRDTIPISMQGRVYALRNALQYATIPCGNLLAGWLIDMVLEPLMAKLQGTVAGEVLGAAHKGSGAGLMILLDGCAGVLVCIVFYRRWHACYEPSRDAGK